MSVVAVQTCLTPAWFFGFVRSQVLVWKKKVDRQCIEKVKGFQTPPLLVGQVMEMVMILIGKRLPSQRIQEVRDYPSTKEDLSSRMSSSSSSTKLIVKKSECAVSSSPFGPMQVNLVIVPLGWG